jgi:DNA polymerase III subunit epsilon
MKNFIAIDFETANRFRHSICAVGMVFVEDGKIVDSIYQLINPEEDFDMMNIAIHHITPNDVKDSPTFDIFYQSIKDKIDNQTLVAHYLAFDGYALRDNLVRYQLQPCTNKLLCTYQLSKRLILGKFNYRLDTLCEHYGIDLSNHHHALDDAQACAELMLKLANEFELDDLDSIYNKTNIRYGLLSPEQFHSSLVYSKSKSHGKLDLREIEVCEDADQNNPFYGKSVVFTGKLNLFQRKEAALLIAHKGGIPQNNITKETDYIVLGDFHNAMIKGNKSTKLQKAEKMISEGKELEIISEEDFMKML